MTVHIAFTGPRPDVKPGDRVECRTIDDNWWVTTARSGPSYDDANAIGGRCFLTVAVGPWGDLPSVNWPAEDVRTVVSTDA